MASRYEISTIFKMIDNFSGPMKSIAGSSSVMAKKVSADMQKTQMQIQAAGRALKATAGVAVAAGVALAGKTVVDSVKTYVEFEDAVTKAGTKFKDLDVTSESYNDTLELMQTKAREVGAATKFSAVDASSALEKMAMSGMSSQQAMGMLMGTTNLAAAVGLDLTSAVDMATDALGAFKMTSENADEISVNMNRIADVVARTTNMANTDMDMWFEAVKNGASQFVSLGGDIETFSAAVGILANKSMKGGEAGTVLRNIMLRLSAPAKAGAEALDELGINVFDAEGRMLPFIDILKQFETNLDGVSDQKRSKLLSDIFGARAINGFNLLLQDGVGELTKFTDELYNAGGAAETMAGAQMKSFAGMIEQLKSAYQDKQLSLGKAFEAGGAKEALAGLITYVQNFDVAPIAAALTQIMQAIPGIVGGFVGFVQTLWNLKDVIGAVVIGFGLYKAAMVVLLGVEGAYNAIMTAKSILTGTNTAATVADTAAITAQAAATTGATAATTGFNAALMANPIGLVVAAVVALGFGIYELVKHWDTVKGAMIAAWEWMKNIAAMIWNGILSALNAVKNFFVEFYPIFMTFLGPVGLLVNMIVEVVKNFDNLKKAFTDGGIIAGLNVIGGTILSSLLAPIQKVFELLSKIPGVGSYFSGKATGLADFRSDALGGFGALNEPVTTAPVTSGERAAYTVNEMNNNTSTEVTVTLDKGLKGSISGNAPNVTVQSVSSAAWK